MEYILIFISAIFVNNIVLSQFLGICPFLGVSKKVETAMGMSAAVAFVLTIATIVTFLIQKFVLDVFGLGYLQTITFILVIAGLVQMVEIILKKVSPAPIRDRLRQAKPSANYWPVANLSNVTKNTFKIPIPSAASRRYTGRRKMRSGMSPAYCLPRSIP